MKKILSLIFVLLLVVSCKRPEGPGVELPNPLEVTVPAPSVAPPPVLTPPEPATEEEDNESIIVESRAKIIEMNAGFNPREVKIKVGDTVTWKNVNANRIGKVSSTLGGFQSPRLEPGQEWSFTFTKNGTYKYIDATLTTKNGFVIVE